MCHPAQLSLEQLLKDCRLQRTRGSGPGGQHRNKVETAIVVEHLPTGLRGEASERRSQDQNRRQAIHRLRVKLALCERRPPVDSPSAVWRQRVKAGRISVNPEHEEFPALLAEALNVVCANAFEVSAAAKQLGVTTSQLIKFLKIERGALELINRERVTSGQSMLH